jgi:hypothetical protein
LGTDEGTLALVNSILETKPHTEGPGRLSAEFSRVVVNYGNFEHRPVMIGSIVKTAVKLSAMRFEDRPGLVATSQLVDRIAMSSVKRPKALFGLHGRPSAARFCVGSIAPCDPINFASHDLMKDS